MLRTLATAMIAVSLLAAGCGDDDADPPSATGDAATTTTEPAATTTTGAGSPTTAGGGYGGGSTGSGGGQQAGGADLELAATDLGDVLVDRGGMTLYLFSPDSQGPSTCDADCADRWPPVREMTDVGEGLDPSLLGTTTRSDGDVQATYNGWPLYRFAGDQAPGDVTGQGVGDVWFAVDAAGEAVPASS